MKFYNMGKIMDNVGIQNKYLLTTIVAERARQISTDQSAEHSREGSDEKAISIALADMEAGNVKVILRNETIADAIESELEDRNQPADGEAAQEDADASEDNA